MAAKLPLLFVLFSLFLTSAFSLRLLADDLINPQYRGSCDQYQIQQCRQKCMQQGHRGYQGVHRCIQQCQSQMGCQPGFEMEEGEECGQGCGCDPQRMYQKCRMRCMQKQGGRHCMDTCERQVEQCERWQPMIMNPGYDYEECVRTCRALSGGRNPPYCKEMCKSMVEDMHA